MSVYIAAAMRSPIGKQRGTLAGLEADALAGVVMRAVLDASGVRVMDRVVLGNTTNAGNVARSAALAAGLDAATPGQTVNNQCASGLTAIRLAAESIEAGRCELALAGGVESVSHTLVSLGEGARREGQALPRVRHAPEGWADPGMGPSADTTAVHLGVTREEQDAYAVESYRRAAVARQKGVLRGRVVEACGTAEDELSRRPAPGRERLARYPAAFGAGGTVTAGNCAAAADGAAVVLLGSARATEGARARIVGMASAAGDPAMPALAVIPAIEGVLAASGLTARDIDLWEVNEAFAVKVIAVMRRFEVERERINVLGGAIAYGHPFGASGAVLVVHALAALEASGGRRALVALAGAGGVAEAMVLEVEARP